MNKLRVMEPMITHVTVTNSETFTRRRLKPVCQGLPAKRDFTKIS